MDLNSIPFKGTITKYYKVVRQGPFKGTTGFYSRVPLRGSVELNLSPKARPRPSRFGSVGDLPPSGGFQISWVSVRLLGFSVHFSVCAFRVLGFWGFRR